MKAALKPWPALAVPVLLALGGPLGADYSGWKHSGSVYILTTPEGAGLPASACVEGFPLLVRLHRDFFDFSQARPQGEDLRFSSRSGEPLAYQIEEWDAARGVASIWVRVPKIQGNARQELRLHWGKADAASESSARAVFNESNGYLSVWHMEEGTQDAVGTLRSVDTGTTSAAGVIGKARHFPGGKGIFGGEKIAGYPRGASPHSTQAWLRADRPNGRVIGWGNEQAQGKVVMEYRSPAQVKMDCYFSGANVGSRSPLAPGHWVHAVHTYEKGLSRIYINGSLDGESRTPAAPLAILLPARLWIGGWYHQYDFVGDIDEVRVSKVMRSADWVRLEYESQKPLQTVVGPLVQPGRELSVSQARVEVAEGRSVTLTAKAGGAQKIYWVLSRDGKEAIAAVDRLAFTFEAGRVTGEQSLTLQLRAVYPEGVKTITVPVRVREDIPEPVFTLRAPAAWDGRKTIEVVPEVANLEAMRAKGAGRLSTAWTVSGIAVIREAASGKLVLTRAQNSGTLTVTVAVHNGGAAVERSATIAVKEPAAEAWLERRPTKDEMPEDGQFYARDDRNEGTLVCSGTLPKAADSVFLRLYADDRLLGTTTQKPGADQSYAFAVKLRPGLIRYRVELGTTTDGKEKVLHRAGNLVCGDAYLIQGQSNALATDTGEKSPPATSDWIRSYGGPTGRGDATDWVRDHFGKTGDSHRPRPNLWCNPVWKAEKGEKAELGYWGMELAKRLVASQKMPIFILNGAVGGTRIDEHQAAVADHADLKTIYGRTLWRLQQARLTHGIRAVLWHQGESDQGSDGPTGGYGWESYQQYFLDLSAAWKQDFPNIQHYYLFQIWPNACSMGNGHGDMLREVQRTLPRLYSNLSVMSTLGIRPPGPCHYPLTGWAEFARLIQPLIERDQYGKTPTSSITAPNLKRAYYTSSARDAIGLELDQPIVWKDSLAGELYLDGVAMRDVSGVVSGNIVTLRLKAASTARKITYLKEMSWSQDRLLRGVNGIAALTFCNVAIAPSADGH